MEKQKLFEKKVSEFLSNEDDLFVRLLLKSEIAYISDKMSKIMAEGLNEKQRN